MRCTVLGTHNKISALISLKFEISQPGATARRWGCCARSRWRLQGLLRPLLPRNWTREPVLCTVATLPGAAAREIRAWDEVAKSCVDRRATDAPDAETITGRLQELGAQYRAPILPGALTLTLASRAPPRVSWSTTFFGLWTLEELFRGNGVICRTQRVIQGDDNGHVGRPCEVSPAPPCPELFCELRGLCRHSYFGPRTCGRSR